MTTAIDLIRRKSDGETLSAEEITFLIQEQTQNRIPVDQMAEFLTCLEAQAESPDEIPSEMPALVLALRDSGQQLDLSGVEGGKVDLWRLGSDPISPALAPLVAAAGGCVPMLWEPDPLLPELVTQRSLSGWAGQLETIQVAAITPPQTISPAFGQCQAAAGSNWIRILDLCGKLSQRLALGVQAIVLSISIQDEDEADEWLAQTDILMEVGQALGLRMVGLILDTQQPASSAIGSAVQWIEAQQFLNGQVKSRYGQLTLELAGHMLWLGGQVGSPDKGKKKALEAIKSGLANERWRAFLVAQGIPLDTADPERLAQTPQTVITAPRSGYLTHIDRSSLTQAARQIGAIGQAQPDLEAGIRLLSELGSQVVEGDPLAILYGARSLEGAALLRSGLSIQPKWVKPPDLIRRIRTLS